MDGSQMQFDRVEDAIRDIADGKMVIVADDEDRENEGDLVCAAAKVTPEIINFMATHGRGLICVALTRERADELDLSSMADVNTEAQRTDFTVSVDASARFGVTTGISAADRAKTIEVCIDPHTVPADLRKALAANPAAKATWAAATTVARRDWIAWMTSGKKAETRGKRLASMIDMLEHGKKRVCCFDRSGMYGNNFSAPEAAE